VSSPSARLALPLAAAAFCAFVVAWGVSTLWWPFGPDQGVFAWIGDVVLAGGQPYRDAWETKGPFAFYLAALARALFGRGTAGLRAFDFLLLVGALVAVGRMTAATVRAAALADDDGAATGDVRARVTAWLAAGLYFAVYAASGYWNTAQPEAWGATVVAAGMALLLTRGRRPGRWVAPLSAALIGSTALLKPFFAGFVLLPLLWVLLPSDDAPGAPGAPGAARPVGAALAVLAGAAVPVLLCFAWLAAHGVLDDYLRVHLLFTAQVYTHAGASPVREFPRSLLVAFGGARYGALSPLAAAALAHLWRGQRRTAVVLGTWLLLAVGMVVIQRRFWTYQWIPALAPLTVLAGVGAAWLAARLGAPGAHGAAGAPRPGHRRPSPLAALAAAWLVTVAANWLIDPAAQIASWLRLVTGHLPAERWAARFEPPRYRDAPGGLPDVGRYVRARTRPDDRILVWSHQPVLYPLAGRPSATRFGFLMPLVMGPSTPRQREDRAIFQREVEASRPAYVIVVPEDEVFFLPRRAGAYIDELPAMRALLAARYAPDTTIGMAVLYRRRD
jgi:hypothetical protein